jgi:hypothetical protein
LKADGTVQFLGSKGMLKKLRLALPAVAVIVWSMPALSQSCALCYTQAASSGARFVSALRDGILILIAPPILMSVGITWLAYRKRNQFRADVDSDEQFREDRESPEQ